MRRIISIGLILSLLFVTSCSLGGPSLDKANKLLDDEKYSDAIDMFQELIDENETEFDAWFGIVEAYMQDEEFGDAEDTLEEMLDVIIDNYDIDDEDIDYESIVEDFQDYVADIIKENDEIGAWYTDFLPAYIDVQSMDFETFGIDEEIMLSVPEGAEVYYNLEGKSVSMDDEKYEGSIKISEVGEYTLMVASINEIGMKGEESSAFITISDVPVVKLTANYTSGTYDGPISIFIDGYDSNLGDVFYVLDGSNPEYGILYDSYGGIELYAGDYNLSAIYYDSDNNEFSDPINIQLSVTGEVGGASFDGNVVINLAILDAAEGVTAELEWAIDEFEYLYDNITVNITKYGDYNDIINAYDAGNGPDVIYTWTSYAIELYNYIGDVTTLIDIENDYDFYPGVVESTFYWDAYYGLPITTRPFAILYYNYYGLDGYYDNGIDYDTMVSEIEMDPESPGLMLPSSSEIMTFLSYYYGFGGTVENNLGYLTLDHDVLVETLQYYLDMSNQGILDPTTTIEMWQEAFTDGSADFIVADPLETQLGYIAVDYEPLGLAPISGGGNAVYPSVVDGLLVGYELTLEPTSDKAEAVKLLYKHLAFDTYYNGYIAGASGAMPVITGIANDYDYWTALPLDLYEDILMVTPPLSNDLYEIIFYYADLESIISNVLAGVVTPEVGATQIIAAVEENAYAQ